MKNLKFTVLAACVALAALQSFGDIRAVTPCQPDSAAARSWWPERHDEKMELVRKGGAPIVFVGDSITHFWETKGKEHKEKIFRYPH